MSTSRKIQIALVASLLWSSTSISSFAATNSITSEKFQSDTVKLPVESIPFRQLNLTPDTYLIAGNIRNILSKNNPRILPTFEKFDEIWKNPADRKKRLFDYCNAQKDFPVKECFDSYLGFWIIDKEETAQPEEKKELKVMKDELTKMFLERPRPRS